MIDSLVQLLARQVRAIEVLEGRLRALSLIVAAGEHRFLMQALEELERASEHLASLELSRSLVVATAGFPVDVSADELVTRHGVAEGTALALRVTVDELRTAMHRLAEVRSQTDHQIRAAATSVRQRHEAAETLAAV